MKVTVHLFQYLDSDHQEFYSYKTDLENTSVSRLYEKALESKSFERTLDKFDYVIESEPFNPISSGTIWFNEINEK